MAPPNTGDRGEAAVAAAVLAPFHGVSGELIPMLQALQERLGYLPETALRAVAERLGVSLACVHGVATFYAQFRLEPVGDHVVRVCRGTACHVRGADRILRGLTADLGIEPGHTTADRHVTLECVACFGSCALAPVVVLDEQVHGRMTPARMREALPRVPAAGAAVTS